MLERVLFIILLGSSGVPHISVSDISAKTSISGQNSEPVGHLTGGLNWQYANIAYCSGVDSGLCWKEPIHDGGNTS